MRTIDSFNKLESWPNRCVLALILPRSVDSICEAIRGAWVRGEEDRAASLCLGRAGPGVSQPLRYPCASRRNPAPPAPSSSTSPPEHQPHSPAAPPVPRQGGRPGAQRWHPPWAHPRPRAGWHLKHILFLLVVLPLEATFRSLFLMPESSRG